jgi:hypothetical protein
MTVLSSPGALLLLGSGTWSIATVYGGWAFLGTPWLSGMVALFAFQFIETKHDHPAVSRAPSSAHTRGARARERAARSRASPGRAHTDLYAFLDMPIPFVIVMLGTMRPNTVYS